MSMYWLRSLEPEGLYKEILSEYLLTYDKLTDTLERLDRRTEELADQDAYRVNIPASWYRWIYRCGETACPDDRKPRVRA